MTKATKTLNPLHFEDLDPHRFEDLVRQLVYDFRTWRSLEPTGRLGSDDGYDARGFEIINAQELDIESGEEEENADEIEYSDRLWQIQCKREKAISPKDIEKYSEEMIPDGADVPYGVIFTAACDFSKKTRDAFANKMRAKGVQEFYLWGKADLEDILIQPKNDHLLYAYFGISLVIRRRSLKTQLRSLLAIKRKVVKHLGGFGQRSHTVVLIRDASDKHYPYTGKISDFKKRPRWKMYAFIEPTHEGIRVLTARYPAYREMDYETMKLVKWDYSEEVNLAIEHADIWNKDKDWQEKWHKAHSFLDTLSEDNQAFFEIEGIIPYERIIEIDPLGDDIAKCPHIYIEVKDDAFFEYSVARLISRQHSWGYIHSYSQKDEKVRKKIFPKNFPEPKKPDPLPSVKPKKAESKDEINPEFKELTEGS